jgi:hypothetical protein
VTEATDREEAPRVTGATDHGEAALARGLAARLRDAAAAADRLADFAFSEAGEPAPAALRDGEERDAALDFVLRALAAAGDATNHAILSAAGDGGVAVADLAARTGLPRLAVLERVHGLLALGLVARDLPADTVHATPAGRALLELVEDLADEVAGWLAKRRRA